MSNRQLIALPRDTLGPMFLTVHDHGMHSVEIRVQCQDYATGTVFNHLDLVDTYWLTEEITEHVTGRLLSSAVREIERMYQQQRDKP